MGCGGNDAPAFHRSPCHKTRGNRRESSMTGETSCRAVARHKVALHLSRHMGPQAFSPFRSPVPQCSSTHLRAFSCTFNRFAQSSEGQHFLFAPLPSQVTAPFPPRWQNAASRIGNVARSATHWHRRRVVLLIVARGDGVRGNTSLHCCATPAWGRFHYAIDAVDAQAARTASITSIFRLVSHRTIA